MTSAELMQCKTAKDAMRRNVRLAIEDHYRLTALLNATRMPGQTVFHADPTGMLTALEKEVEKLAF